MPEQAPIVIGLDLSLTGSGLADSLGRVTTIGRKGVTTLPLDQRWRAMASLAADIWTWIGGCPRPPELAVVEGMEGFSRQTGAAVSERAFLWWWIVGGLLKSGCPIVSAHPSKIKIFATGNGAAPKGDIVDAVNRWKLWPGVGKDNNRADAVVLCAIGARLLSAPIVEISVDQERAMEGLVISGGYLAKVDAKASG